MNDIIEVFHLQSIANIVTTATLSQEGKYASNCVDIVYRCDIPYLWGVLGAVKKQHDMQEIACHNLDHNLSIEHANANAAQQNLFFNKHGEIQKKRSKHAAKIPNLHEIGR